MEQSQLLFEKVQCKDWPYLSPLNSVMGLAQRPSEPLKGSLGGSLPLPLKVKIYDKQESEESDRKE